MKVFKLRAISLLLVVIFILFVFISCDKEKNTTDNPTEQTTQNTETTPTYVKDDLPDYDMKNVDYRILSYLNDFTNGHTVAEAVTGDVLNDEIYRSTMEIEKRFNVNLVETIMPSSYINTDSKVWVKAGSDEYDHIVILDRSGLSWAQEALAIRYDLLPYIDMEKPYWDAGINKSVSISGNYFMAAGAANLTVYDYTHILLFNKKMIEEEGLENPYTLVQNNNWTFEKYSVMMQQVLKDNGDGVANDLDTYGFVTTGKQILPNMWIAAKETTVTKDENDIPHFSIFESNNFFNVYDKVMDIMYNSKCWYVTTVSSGTWYNDIHLFESDQSLFAGHTFFTASAMRQKMNGFGIVPYPKYSEGQDDFYSRVEGGIRMMLIPTTNTRFDETSIIMEAMHCAAYNYQIPAYYDVVLKSKTANDEESAQMLDIILANRVYDLGDSYWYSIIRRDIFENLFSKNIQTPVSTIRSMQAAINRKIETDIKPFQ